VNFTQARLDAASIETQHGAAGFGAKKNPAIEASISPVRPARAESPTAQLARDD